MCFCRFVADVNMVAEPKPHQTGRKRQNVTKTGNDWWVNLLFLFIQLINPSFIFPIEYFLFGVRYHSLNSFSYFSSQSRTYICITFIYLPELTSKHKYFLVVPEIPCCAPCGLTKSSSRISGTRDRRFRRSVQRKLSFLWYFIKVRIIESDLAAGRDLKIDLRIREIVASHA